MNNEKKYLLTSILYSLGILLTTATVLQSYLLHVGISEARVATYSSLIQFAQVATMLPLTVLGDKVKRIHSTLALTAFCYPFLVVALLLARTPSFTLTGKFGVVLAGGMLVNLLLGVYSVLCYKFPYCVLDMKKYGKLTGISGVVSNVLGLGATFSISLLSRKIPYELLASGAFILAAVVWIALGCLYASFKVKPAETLTSTDENYSVAQLFRLPVFYKLLPAHLLRGIANGVAAILLVVASAENILSEQNASIVPFLTVVASVTGNAAYLVLNKKYGDRALLLFFCIVFAATMPLCFFKHSVISFFLFYFLCNLSNIALSIAAPVLIASVVPYGFIGKYTSWRMLTFTLGTAIPGLLFGPIQAAGGSVWFVAFGGLCMAASGVLYAAFAQKPKNR